jgi:hypothetical protein
MGGSTLVVDSLRVFTEGVSEMYEVVLDGEQVVWGVDDLYDYLSQYGVVEETVSRITSRPILHLIIEDVSLVCFREWLGEGPTKNYTFIVYKDSRFMAKYSGDVVRAVKMVLKLAGR